jgi:hypothetical protein
LEIYELSKKIKIPAMLEGTEDYCAIEYNAFGI